MGKDIKECTIRLRVSKKLRNRIKMKASIYAHGNMSEWARHCLENYEPKFLKKKPRRKAHEASH